MGNDMTQENKELLLKDLCTRLPYGVIVETPKGKGHVCDINLTIFGTEAGVNIKATSRDKFNIEDIKPYLFPFSSMTEEQREELYKIGWYFDEDKIYSCFRNYDDVNYKTHTDCFELINWCYKNHFDINGLIPMGLANDATGKNIY
jgi:hypothetical protein